MIRLARPAVLAVAALAIGLSGCSQIGGSSSDQPSSQPAPATSAPASSSASQPAASAANTSAPDSAPAPGSEGGEKKSVTGSLPTELEGYTTMGSGQSVAYTKGTSAVSASLSASPGATQAVLDQTLTTMGVTDAKTVNGVTCGTISGTSTVCTRLLDGGFLMVVTADAGKSVTVDEALALTQKIYDGIK